MKQVQIIDYFKPHITTMSFGVTIKFLGTIMDLGLPWVLAYIIDTVIPKRELSQVFLWGGIMLLLSIAALVGNVIANRIASAVARDITERLRHDLFGKILYLSNTDADRITSPSLISRMTTDTYHIHHMIGMMQRLGIRAPILLIGGIAVTLTLDKALTGTLVIVLPFIAALVAVITSKGIPLYKHLQESIDQMVKTIREDITGIRVIKALSKGDYEKKRLEEKALLVSSRETKAAVTMALTNPGMNLLLNIGFCFVVLLGAWRVNQGLTKVGKVVAFTSYFAIILNAILGITRMFVAASKGSASISRIREVLNAEAESDSTCKKEDIVSTAAVEKAASFDSSDSKAEENGNKYHIVFKGVNFSYYKNNETGDQAIAEAAGSSAEIRSESFLKEISFQIPYGGTLGIIGSTGSGKTTILNLLLRFYEADSGTIYVDGRNILDYEIGELRMLFGTVFQNDLLFSNTIESNIIFGREIQNEQVKKAANHAMAHEFIIQEKDGYERMLSAKGNNLSGGQKQRLMIARALAGEPKILVLDGSFSALDYKTDSMLRRTLKEQYSHMTKIISAQRISAVMGLDQILVLEDGAVVGCGTHQELMEGCSIYQDIHASQLGR